MSTRSSGFGARRSLSFADLPYVGKRFYVDVRSNAQRTKVIQRIQNLGGHIENFLSKDVDLLVTDAKDRKEQSGAGKNAAKQNLPLSRGKLRSPTMFN
ncbi:hypothetical protein DPMN_081714 [Dreissena polymorpha]|uniref:BRCT domain-containing protein n=1 Tax=Dreissena polymorpha TaxID=45954 RepID=A0A9D3Y953_DREPO|nr:hypothetical protein DPMN_081714 [Dreissena polymorpha]